MELIIISPQDEQRHTIVWLDIITPHGNFVIRDGHAPMIVTLLPEHAFTFALENGVQKSIQINRAMIEIGRTQVRIIMNELV